MDELREYRRTIEEVKIKLRNAPLISCSGGGGMAENADRLCEWARAVDLNVFLNYIGGDPPAWPLPPTPPGSPEQKKTDVTGDTTGRATPQLKVDTSSKAAGASMSTAAGTTAVPPTSVAIDQTTRAINGLLNAMQQTLGALGNTFDVLGEQTLSVATLGPAVDAVIKIEKVRKEVNTRHAKQDVAMKSTEDSVKGRVADIIREKLRPKVDEMVADAVAQHVQNRVRDELRKQVSQKLKNELEEHRRRILEVKIALANAIRHSWVLDASSEAQRHNAHIPSDAFGHQPLHPLLRPFAGGAPLGTPERAANGSGGTRLPAENKKKDKDSKKKNGAADGTSNGNGAGPDGGSSADAGTRAPGAAAVETPSPSPLFPQFISDLRTMAPGAARQLVVDYGLAGDGEDEEDWDDDASTVKDDKNTGKKGNTSKDSDKPKPETPKQKEEREKKEAAHEAAREQKLQERERRRTEHLNDFMRFIGVSSLFSCLVLCLLFSTCGAFTLTVLRAEN
ncbi:hypothetical protein TRAPUB_7250 [Trametes pubescens]|uniref:Uncharacterized protein n=1 Tax=Trametes pubescens TaxID=154538 RepID=A0A1M2V3V0_TRAPU|nr:hypothetical protein TRAPUB_7250 [Trametes pubescens]